MELNMSLPEAIDLSHHLSELAKARKASPLKSLQKYLNKPGLISLAGGLPPPEYFPFSTVGGSILTPESLSTTNGQPSTPWSWIWSLLSARDKEGCVTIPKYATDPAGLDLARSLQYSRATGNPVLCKITKEFTEKVYQPGYSNYETLMHDGNTDAWAKVVLTLCNDGEGILMGEWTYPSAMSAIHPYNITPVPVALDSQGIRPDSLRKVLSEWDESARGMERPHVLYTVPVGQNPTGTLARLPRKEEVYKVCVEFDVIIVEDDPYYFLQQQPYVPAEERAVHRSDLFTGSDDEYFSTLTPSYVHLDYQGRVIRLDSFSKVIAPGCRMGWFTCAPVFAEKLERISEVTSQAPCGFAQALVSALLLEWGSAGYMRWLKVLPTQYQRRRDFMLDCFHDNFYMKSECSVVSNVVQHKYHGHFKLNSPFGLEKEMRPVFSLTPPDAGMFIWITIHFENHPLYPELDSYELEMKLWEVVAESGVLFGPGWIFASDQNKLGSDGHFRISFSNGKDDEVRKAIRVLATSMRHFFSLTSKVQFDAYDKEAAGRVGAQISL